VDISTLNIKKDLIYATNPVGTGNYTFAAAHAAIWNEKLGINVTVEPTTGAEGCIYALEDGCELAIVNGYYAKDFWTAGFADSFNVIRTVAVGDPMCFSFITNADSGIKSVDDFRGNRVTYAGLSSAHTLMANAILKAYGITEDDITVLEMSSSGAGLVDLAEGRTDAVIASIAGSKMDELASKINPYIVEYDDAHAQLIQEYSDGLLVPAKIKSDMPGTYKGAPLLASVNEILCSSELDDDTVYALTRINLENTGELAAIAADLQYWDNDSAISIYANFPYHTGAIKYYKEIGIWTDAIDNWNKALLDQYHQAK
jgi:TRAP transporter TAXI family solute receptor